MAANNTPQCTGFFDSEGGLIKFGNRVRLPIDANTDIHGHFAVYKLIHKGCAPFVSYLYSEKGQVLPVGMTGCMLTDLYDSQDFGKFKDMAAIRPNEELLIIEEDMPD